jgi:uncharacterized protein YijF (DUF1287 family)
MYTALPDLRMFSLLVLLLLQPRATVPPAGVRIAAAAAMQVGVTTIYDPSYVSLRYPGGDLPPERGVCADVIVRAFRAAVGVDLQREIHEDMRRAFRAYPSMWGLSTPDANIDHRRVPNLMTFFARRGKKVPGDDFQPGDIVAWRLPGGLYHIGIVAAQRVPGAAWHYVVHNIGRGAQREDVLHAFEIIGHYRW